MADSFASLVKEHHAFYEVSPNYVELEERPVGHPAKTRTVQAGFNVDVYGVRTDDNAPEMPPAYEYALGYAELKKIAERVSQHSSDSCSVEVISFSRVAIIDPRNQGKPEAIIRIRISHDRGLDPPAGPAEQQALEELENELKSLGIAHR